MIYARGLLGTIMVIGLMGALGFFLYSITGPMLIYVAMLAAWFVWFKSIPQEDGPGDLAFIIPVAIVLIAGFA
jgi:hypothetical protein